MGGAPEGAGVSKDSLNTAPCGGAHTNYVLKETGELSRKKGGLRSKSVGLSTETGGLETPELTGKALLERRQVKHLTSAHLAPLLKDGKLEESVGTTPVLEM